MRLVCKKYRWFDPTLGENEVNFFSTSLKTLVQTIDLKYYLLKDTLSEFESTQEGIDDTSNGLEIKMSNVSFQCKNEILGLTSLQDFFEVYDKNDKIKFRFEYYNDDNNLLFSGIIYKDGVEFSSRSNDVLDIIAVTEEKEFIDYFSKKDLVYPESWAWLRLGTLLGFSGTGRTINLVNQVVFRLIDVLQANFTNVTISGIPSTYYYILLRPYTYAPFSADHTFKDMGDLLHIRTGMNQFVNDKWKVYDYFSSMFQAKGWVWYFSKGSLYIKDRSQSGLNTTSIDFATEVLSHSVSSDILEKQVDNVNVYNGSYFDNGSTNGVLNFTDSQTGGVRRYVGGASRAVYTIQEYTNNIRPFKKLEYSSAGTSNRYLKHWVINNFSVVQEEDERQSKRKRISLTGNNLFPTYSETILTFAAQRTLFIDPGATSQAYAAGIDLNNAGASSGNYYGNGNFYYSENQPSTDSHLFYTGNPASSMIRYNPIDEFYYTYERDCEGEDFKNNFKKFVRSANPIIFDMEVKKEITDPFQNILITNYPYKNSVNSKTFSIQRLSYNDVTKITKLTLQML